jgi:hypothetical protein
LAITGVLGLGRPLIPLIRFELITYGDQIGCGLYVELYLDGQLAMDDQGRSGSFILGSPPDRTVEECLERCAEGLSNSFIAFLKATMPADYATGWCFKGRDVIGGPYEDLPQESTDAACSDEIDNDGDQLTDCADASCSQNERVVVCPEPRPQLLALVAMATLAGVSRRQQPDTRREFRERTGTNRVPRPCGRLA